VSSVSSLVPFVSPSGVRCSAYDNSYEGITNMAASTLLDQPAHESPRITGLQENKVSPQFFFIFLGTEEYNYTIFLGTETDEYIHNR
jgi:hypothetical protein